MTLLTGVAVLFDALAALVSGTFLMPRGNLAALFVMGATDMVSIFIRNNLVQLVTPDDVRGRVNAVSSVFVGASNELGDTRDVVLGERHRSVSISEVGGAARNLYRTGIAGNMPFLLAGGAWRHSPARSLSSA